jgi:aryl-alcohol dehydrogenase-like predicted oxidoreductase
MALGTVQYGMTYGLNNKQGVPSDLEVKDILNRAFESGIKILDTAPAYGNAEERIAKYSGNKFKIVTKFSNVNSAKDFNGQINQSLKNLNTSSVFGYIAHNPDQLLQNKWLWNILGEFKIDGKVEKVGYSLYTTEQLERLLEDDMIPDLIQIPYSLLDRKFEPYFSCLKGLGTEIHTRSTFLQGLYFMSPSMLPSKLYPLRNVIQDLHSYCLDNNLEIGALALNFVYNNSLIDHIVVGVDSLNQLNENLSLISTSILTDHLLNFIDQIIIKDKELLNPANWN